MSRKLFKTAIVIPAFNEGATIGRVIKLACKYGTVIVVNDASTDNTNIEAIKMGAVLVNHTCNKGYDEALNSGFLKANELRCDAVITFDADGQHSHELLPVYIDLLKKGVRLVLGVRPKKQRVSETVFAFYTRLMFGWNDPLCGMKGYNMSLYTNRGYFDSLESIGTELAFFGVYSKLEFSEVNIPEIKRQDTPRFHSTYTANLKIIKSLINLIRKYR
ncbi:glycosyltransferase family 2 protein [Amylibacter sp.]|jgi:glycosyltransferase involved in cell wall biosynthesis|nr:glycosyltransferase family 2 protein [Amylibacter sp.]